MTIFVFEIGEQLKLLFSKSDIWKNFWTYWLSLPSCTPVLLYSIQGGICPNIFNSSLPSNFFKEEEIQLLECAKAKNANNTISLKREICCVKMTGTKDEFKRAEGFPTKSVGPESP